MSEDGEKSTSVRSAAEDLLHVLTYDQSPRTFSAQWLAAVENLSKALDAPRGDPEAAVARMRAWASEHPEADTQGLMDDEWEALATAALGGF